MPSPENTIKKPGLPALAKTIVSAPPSEQTLVSQAKAGTRVPAVKGLPTGLSLGGELGRGGFGLVNVATQEVFGRRVAVKRLFEAGSEDARRFHAEAVVTANLQHPNVVPIHDLTLDGDGRLQLVMKMIEGVSWSELLAPTTPAQRQRAQAMSGDDHLDILLKVCDAIGFAHDRGVLHRDLKPDNVMVGAFGEVQVMDWGCAVAFGQAAHHPAIPRVEAIDQIVGTPAYMAPEMTAPRLRGIGPHTDVYLLGGILYRILTGTPPHPAPTIDEALAQAAAGVVEPPDERAPDRRIPDELAWIAMSALARDPSERTATVAAFARQLKDYRNHAEATKLALSAKRLVIEAGEHPEQAEDLLRRAMATADNALELWPERAAALRVRLRATLAYAQHALVHGDFVSAGSTAARAAGFAEELHAPSEAKSAATIIADARAGLEARRAHERHVRVLQRALVGAGVVVLVGLISGVAILSAQQRRTRQALDETQATLERLRAEQESRRADQRRAAPGLVTQARQFANDKRIDDAERVAAIAADFDPDLGDARALVACFQAARGRFAEARASAAEWSRLAPTGDGAKLAELCERAQAAGSDLPPALTLAFGELFARQRLVALAEGRLLSPEQRVAFYRRRIEEVWPGAGAGLSLAADGCLRFDGDDGRPCLEGLANLSDLRPLAGMPFETLSLAGTAACDLSPLAKAPLTSLDLAGSKVTDLSPLAACTSLERIDLSRTEVTNLEPLAATHLRVLRAVDDRKLSDLSPLAARPLEEVAVAGSAVRDLSRLAPAELRELDVGRCAIADWSALKRFTLHGLTVDGCAFDDAALVQVRSEALERLGIADTRVSNLAPLKSMKGLHELSLGGLPVSDLTTLAGLPLRVLRINRTKVADLTLLRTAHTLVELDASDTPLRNNWTLSGLHLTKLRLSRTRLDELSALDVSALNELAIDGTGVSSLEPLASAPLKRLSLRATPVSDLAPLVGVPLTSLAMAGSRVTSLRALRGLVTLRELEVDHIPATDYGPIAELPLERLVIGPFTDRRTYQGLVELRRNPTLKTIGVYATAASVVRWWPAAEFWRRLDAGELAKIE